MKNKDYCRILRTLLRESGSRENTKDFIDEYMKQHNDYSYESKWNKFKRLLMDNYLCRKEEFMKSKNEDERVRALIYSEMLTIMNLIEEGKYEEKK